MESLFAANGCTQSNVVLYMPARKFVLESRKTPNFVRNNAKRFAAIVIRNRRVIYYVAAVLCWSACLSVYVCSLANLQTSFAHSTSLCSRWIFQSNPHN